MNPFWSQTARRLSPYVPGEQPRIANLVKLNTNESPFGPSPLALEAMRAAMADALRLYPDPEATELREALAAHHGVKPEQVFVGNGSDEVLAHAFVALLKQPKPLLFPDVTYSFYPVWAQLFGVAFETVPLDDGMRVRIEDYRRAAGSIVIANPNAPTGIALPRSDIVRLLKDHPDIPVLIDEAYIHFAGAPVASSLAARHKDVVVLRTFSKIFGMAGMRMGFVMTNPANIAKMMRYDGGMQSGALPLPSLACATASLTAARLIAARKAEMEAARGMTLDHLKARGLRVVPTAVNMVMIDWKSKPAKEMQAAFRTQSVEIGRSWPIWPTVSRITIGSMADMKAFCTALDKVWTA